jgi:hypothetical protein
MAGQADLRVRVARAQQNARSQLQAAISIANLQGPARDHFRLIKPALPALPLEKRHWNDKNYALCKFRLDFSNGFGQHPAQNICGWPYSVEFEQMNQFPQSTFVTTVSYSPFKRTIDATANRASPQVIVIGNLVGRENSLPADGTHPSLFGMNRTQTIRTHGQTRDIQQGQTANTAIGGKQN